MKLLFLPWVCKPLYAPLLERTLSRSTWLILALITMAMTCLMASLTVHQTDLTSLSLVLLLLNLASAAQVHCTVVSRHFNQTILLQDVCVDALALEILQPSELGAGNTIQVRRRRDVITFSPNPNMSRIAQCTLHIAMHMFWMEG